MAVPNGLLTIERVFDDLASPKTYVYSLENSLSLGTIACAITSPTAGATVTQGTPVTIAGTITTAGTVVVKLGSTTLGSATMVGLNWSYSWTPQAGDVGAQTLNATATASVGGATANAAGVAVTVAAVSGFSGDWAALFPGAYLVLQPGGNNGAVSVAATTIATGTAPPVGTMTGSFSGQTKPIWFKCTTGGAIGAGAVFSAYADGLGVTPFMTGITPTAGTPVALTGVGAGLSHAWAAGTANVDNVWKMAAAVPDRSGNGKHSVATAGTYPVVTAGNNGRACVKGDGSDDLLKVDALNLPAPGTTPYYTFMVARFTADVADQTLLGNGDFAVANIVAQAPGNTGAYEKNATQINVTGITPGNWNIYEIKRSNNASDTFKVGAVSVTGNAGNNATTNFRVFGSPGAGANAAAEVAVLVITPNLPDWVAVRAAVASEYTGVAA